MSFKLLTERLEIRELTLQDLDVMIPFLADHQVMHFSLKGPLTTKEQAQEFLQKILNHYKKFGFGIWALIHKQDRKFIGIAGLATQIIDGEEHVELGYRLDPRYWKKGLASEAAASIIKYAFNTLNLLHIISIIDPRNLSSIKLARRAGMHFWKESTFHDHFVHVFRLEKLTLLPYQSDWEIHFLEEKQKLSDAFKGLDIELYFIGSTSIPDCYAKPILDILGVVSDITLVDNYSLKELHFESLGEFGMEQRRYYRKKGHFPYVHLHIFEDSDPECERHLRFCHYLRRHPQKREEYSLLKQRLAKECASDIARYTQEKTPLIKSIDISAAWEAKEPLLPQRARSRKKKWTQEGILKAMDVNLHLMLSFFSKYLPLSERPFQPDASILKTYIKDPAFNYIFSAHLSSSHVHERITALLKHFEKPPLPFTWLVGPFDHPESETLLLAHGLSLTVKMRGMFLDLDTWSSPPNSTLTFKQIMAPEEMKIFGELVTEFGITEEAKDLIFSQIPPILYQTSSLQIFISYDQGKPVGTGMLLLHANTAGIYYLMTLPPYRHRGFSTAMILHLLSIAKSQGYHLSTLQTGLDTLPFYQRLGFKEGCVYKEYGKP